MTCHFLHQFPVTLGERIRAARRAKGISQDGLAQLVGRHQTAISLWERDEREPSRHEIVRLASKLNIPIADLEGFLRDQRDIPEIPLLSWVSAGQVSDVGSLEAATAEERIAIADLPPGDYFATDVKGDSMDRISPDRSRIIVNTSDKRLIPGKAYVFSVRGETTYKIYQDRPVQRLEPYSTNPLNRTIFLEGQDTWNVVGRVWRSYYDLP